MPELSAAKVYENEIVKYLDFDYTFEQVLKNVEVLGGLLKYGKQTDFVIGGKVNVSSDVVRSVIVSPLLCLGKSLNTPVYNPENSSALSVKQSNSNLERIDIVQVQSVIGSYKPVQRKFYDPFLDAEKNMTVDTRRRLATKYMVKSGEVGSGVAPETDIGWVKLAEIIVPANSTEILPEHIKVVTTPTADEANTEWTTEPTRTVYLGGIDEVKAALRAEDASIRQDFTAADTILQNNINAEAATRQQADTNEATTRSNADTTLQNNINAEINARQRAISNEATARATADSNLESSIREDFAAADEDLQDQINTEKTARQQTDGNDATIRSFLMKGFNTVKPILGEGVVDVYSGGMIEINGSIYTISQKYTFNLSPKTANLFSETTYRIKFTCSGNTVTPSLTTEKGKYSDSKGGYYSGDSRILPETYQTGLIRKLYGEELYELYLEAGRKYRVVLVGAGGGASDGGDADCESDGGEGGFLDYTFTANRDGLAQLSSGSGGKGAWNFKPGAGGRSGTSYVNGPDATCSGKAGPATPGGNTGRTTTSEERYPKIGGDGGVSGGYSGHGGGGGAFGHGGSGYNYGGRKGCGGGGGAASYLYLVAENRLFAAGGGGGAGGDNAGENSNDYPGEPGSNSITGSTGGGVAGGEPSNRNGRDGSASLYIL